MKSVIISTHAGGVKVPAFIICSGLAITRQLLADGLKIKMKPLWAVTHVVSGFAVSRFKTRAQATKMLRLIEHFVDWNLPNSTELRKARPSIADDMKAAYAEAMK